MTDSTVLKIKERLDIVELIGSYLKIEKAGINFRAACPFHREKKPSFFVSPSRQMFKCFGCNASGDIFGFIMQIEGVEFREALRNLAARAGVELPAYNVKEQSERQRQEEICELATKFFERQMDSEKGREVKEYLKKRGLTDEAIKKWRLGYGPDAWQGLSDFLVGKGYARAEIVKAGLAINPEEKDKTPFDRFRARIIFPIFDLNSKVVGFGGRILQGNIDIAKYMNTPNTLLYDKSRIVYGLNFAKMEIRKKNFSVLTEGYTDVILSHQAAVQNAVASSGTSLTPAQLQILKRYSPRLCISFDMDSAGAAATEKSIALANEQDFEVKVIRIPEGKDPADLVLSDPQKWLEAVEKARGVFDFYFENAFSKFDKESAEGKKEICRSLLPKIKTLSNKIVRAHWIQKIALELKLGENLIWEEMERTVVSAPLAELPRKSETVPAPAKKRREVLEEIILSLIFKNNSKIKEVGEEETEFFSPEMKIILNRLKKIFPTEKKVNLPEADEFFEKIKKENEKIKRILDSAFLMTEIRDFGLEPGEAGRDLEKEFALCLSELKKIHFKQKMELISGQIRLAETEGDGKQVEKLMGEFNGLAKKLCF